LSSKVPKLGEPFKPSPKLIRLHFIYLLLVVLFLILPWYIPLALLAPPGVTLVVTFFILIAIGLAGYWILKYYDSLVYKLTGEEVECRKGIWFKKVSVVPYNRITNVDVIQGPISRKLGIATLKLQTAGYSGQVSRAEARIDGLENYEEIKDLVLGLIRRRRPEAVETFEEPSGMEKIVTELVEIRKLLEKLVKSD